MEMETKGTIEAIARNIQKNLKIIEPSLKMGLKEAYDNESTFRISLSVGIKPTSQLDRVIKGRISFPVFKISRPFSDSVDEGQMELEFEEETEAPEVVAKEIECAGCRATVSPDDAFFVSDIGKDLCPDCAAVWSGDEPIDEDPQEDVVEETAPDAGEEDPAPHADWPIPLDPDEIKRLQPVQVAELVALVKEKFPLAHFHAKELLKVSAIRGAAVCREALHHMNGWYRNSGPGHNRTQAEVEHAHENTMGG